MTHGIQGLVRIADTGRALSLFLHRFRLATFRFLDESQASFVVKMSNALASSLVATGRVMFRIVVSRVSSVNGLRLALLGFFVFPLAASAAPLEVTRGDVTSHFLLSGELVAEDAVLLIVPNANIWPVTVRWLEEDGAEVAAGDSIVEFDNSQLASNLEELERSAIEAANQLASLEATVRSEEIEAEFAVERARAELDKARLDADVPADLLADQEFEERRLDLERAELEFEQAKSALAFKQGSAAARVAKQRVMLLKAERAAQRARDGIELLTLRAPRDGVLLVSDHEDEGRTFQSGDTTWPGRTIARLPELSSMIVEAQLFDVDDGRIRPGMPITAVVDAFPEIALNGEVMDVDDIANETNRNSLRRFFRARMRVEGLDLEHMRPGMSVKVVVEERLEDVPLVPRAALGWRHGEAGSAVIAYLADGGSREIVIGPCSSERCVLEEGLEIGERLSSRDELKGAP